MPRSPGRDLGMVYLNALRASATTGRGSPRRDRSSRVAHATSAEPTRSDPTSTQRKRSSIGGTEALQGRHDR